jgi:hypothetical protein
MQNHVYWVYISNTISAFAVYGFHKYVVLLALLCIPGLISTYAQSVKSERGSMAFFDSLDNRVTEIQRQLPRLKQTRDITYYNLLRDLDLTLLVKATEEFIRDEDLDNAKKLVEVRLKKAEFRKEQYSVSFCQRYIDDINRLIKLQRMHYQALFSKEKNFKKEFDGLAKTGSADSYVKTMRMVDLALKYARENNLVETIKYLENYKSYTQALIFDLSSAYDLATLTGSAREFEKIFLPLVQSDSLKDIREAEMLISHCTNYARLTGSRLDPVYFARQSLVVTSSLYDLLESQGREKELEKYTDQAVKARFDTLNPCGVFKWHDQIVVIDEFLPRATMEAVKKGEAIIHADQMLSAYLKKNKLCTSVQDLKFGYAFVIPYHSSAKNTAFYFNTSSQKWQYIACYTVITDADYTLRVSKYMPPLLFQDEKDMANN